MKNMLTLAALALAAAGCAADQPPQASMEMDAALTAELDNYERTGPAVSCVSSRELRGNRSVGGAIVFQGQGDRIWVNRPAGGCPDLRNDALSVRSTGSRLCRGDIATVVDMSSGMTFGGCGLGEFEPYRRRG